MFMDRDAVHKHAISSHLDQASLVNKGFITMEKEHYFLKWRTQQLIQDGQDNPIYFGSQSQCRIQFILPAHGAAI